MQNPSRRAFACVAAGLPAIITGLVATRAPADEGNVKAVTRKYEVTDVTFPSGEETIVGKLLRPAAPGPHPAVAIIGPVAFVKEQSPLQYATRLASEGIAALIFDPSFHGASSGEPRRFESPEAKINDLSAALNLLETVNGVDGERLGVLGICQGVNWALEAANRDERVRALGLVAGHYLSPETTALYVPDEDELKARLDRSYVALAAWEQNGAATYIPVVGGEDALLKHGAPRDWYEPWSVRAPWLGFRGQWENRITTMSEAMIWNWRSDESMKVLAKPLLMIHGDRAATGPTIPKTLFETVPAREKSLRWIDGANQLQFYEDPIVIDSAVSMLAPHFARDIDNRETQ